MSENFARRPTWVEINLNRLADNFHSIKEFVGSGIEYMAVVKADAYGHGAVPCAQALEKAGIDWFGVALPEEGLELRKNGIKSRILCLGGFWEGQENFIIENNLTPVIFQTEKARMFDRASKKAGLTSRIHVKIDTGMGRIGVRWDQLGDFLRELKKLPHLEVEGIMTHFASADDLDENEFTQGQIDKFYRAVEIFEDYGFFPKYKDLANSPGAVAHENSRSNLVRLGGILYGLGGDVLPRGIVKPKLEPVMTLHSKIAFLKEVPEGETVGYGRTHKTERRSIIATVPIGYQDGFVRSLSNCGRVLVNNQFAPIVGRISMDWTILDVTDIPRVKVNDEVVLIGQQNGLSILAEDLARQIGTISYEITCGINRRVIRNYVESE